MFVFDILAQQIFVDFCWTEADGSVLLELGCRLACCSCVCVAALDRRLELLPAVFFASRAHKLAALPSVLAARDRDPL